MRMDNRTGELLEQYEDALMALLMDEYAEANGAQLLEEYEKAERNGAISDVPEKLDKKCMDLIQRSYAKQRMRVRLGSIVETSKRLASISLVILGLCSVLVISVEAIRTPVVNYIIKHYEQLTTIDFDNSGSNSTTTPTEEINEPQPMDRSKSPLVGMISDSYNLVRISDKGARGLTCFYEDKEGNTISFAVTPAEGMLNVDTENATVTDVKLRGHSGMLIEKDGYKIVWFDANVGIFFQLRTTGLNHGELWSLAEAVAECPEWANLVFGG